MTVHDLVRPVTVPRQAAAPDTESAPPAPAPPAAEPAQIGRDRPLTADERFFALGLTAMFLVLSTYLVTFLLVGQFIWTP